MLKRRGDSLVEVVVAVAIISVVILALVRVTTVAINNATFAKNQATATNYAREVLEDARRLKETNLSTFFDSSNSPCTYSVTTVGSFTRTRQCDFYPNLVQVTATVKWTDALGDHQSQLMTNLTKWE
jgi:prepilin-type N-terminal cleavage/methylation domain-containing protein